MSHSLKKSTSSTVNLDNSFVKIPTDLKNFMMVYVRKGVQGPTVERIEAENVQNFEAANFSLSTDGLLESHYPASSSINDHSILMKYDKFTGEGIEKERKHSLKKTCTVTIDKGYTVVPSSKNKKASASDNQINLDQTFKQSLYVCNTCRKIFNRRGNVIEHLKLHTNKKPFSCEICQKKFATKGELTKHSLCHFQDKPYLCDICGKQFPRLGSLRRHLFCHGAETSRYVCDTCGMSFARSDAFKEHADLHNGADLTCGVCGKTLKSQRGLRRHHQLHHGPSSNETKLVKKSFICSICNQGFAMKGTLKNHMVTHTNKEYRNIVNSCTICGASFYHKDSIKRHMVIHTDSRPYKCPQCGKAFRQKATLKTHENSHSEATSRPHVCRHCKKGFSRTTGLRYHKCSVRSVGVEEPSKVHTEAESKMTRENLATSNEELFAYHATSGNADDTDESVKVNNSLATQFTEDNGIGRGGLEDCDSLGVTVEKVCSTTADSNPDRSNAIGAIDGTINQGFGTVTSVSVNVDRIREHDVEDLEVVPLGLPEDIGGDVDENIDGDTEMDPWSTGWTGGSGSCYTLSDGLSSTANPKGRDMDNEDDVLEKKDVVCSTVSVKRQGGTYITFVDISMPADNETFVGCSSAELDAALLERRNAAFDKKSVCNNLATMSKTGVDSVTTCDKTIMEYNEAKFTVTSIKNSVPVEISAGHLGPLNGSAETRAETLVDDSMVLNCDDVVTSYDNQGCCGTIKGEFSKALDMKQEAGVDKLEPGELRLSDIKVEPLTFEGRGSSWEQISWNGKSEEGEAEFVDCKLRTIKEETTS
ncbi:uncharacterized protein LOC135482157 [Liolophura sinensis]|uniref:uncharacterized protein LOC135482157 n=1 Tax=Liolophura sinensis TaxID=3198878 RepID=UPI0031588E9B